MTLTVAILAGGLATRLRPLTESIPKALLPVAGKPFLTWQLEYLKSQGIKNVVLCTGYLAEQIRKVIGNGSNFGLNINYSEDGDKLLGTGGALHKALDILEDHFFVLYGDSYLPIDFSVIEMEFFNKKKPALMTVIKNNNQWDNSNVVFKNNLLVEYNKKINNSDMKYIDYGLSVLSRSVFNKYPSFSYIDLADLYHDLSVQGNLIGIEVYDRFYEIGSHNGIIETENYLIKNGQ